ncbi:MAG TPA: response regulator transcription factor [Clostridia bacterium]|nr:response regulator transcription factor [Clostridia bacterium]
MTDQARDRDPEVPADESSTPHSIRVIVADTEPIFRVGMRKIFALEDDIRVVAQAESLGQTISAVEKFTADVLLFEAAMCQNPGEAISEILRHAKLRIILLSSEVGEEETVEYLRRGVHGIVTRSIAPDLMVKCIRKVVIGETWLDNKGVNWVIEAYRAQASQLTAPRSRARLSDKELLIVSGVTQGLKNKEIAQDVGTTEQVVKNYLRKVYDKLGVSDRLELALYCMHHRLLEGLNKPAEADAPAGSAGQKAQAAAAAASAAVPVIPPKLQRN